MLNPNPFEDENATQAPATTPPVPRPALMSGAADFKSDFDAGNKAPVTRSVQANELSGNQLADLTSGDSKFIKSARQNSAAASADRGMLMSSVSVGAGEKAAIDAAQPFAMQQADAFGRTASENMNAQNTDAQADQGQFRQAAGQQQQLEASSVEAGRTRDFTANENNTQRSFQSTEAGAERLWRSSEQNLDRQSQMDQQQRANLESRQNSYFAMQANREAQLSTILNSIYSNTALKPAEQQAAANNAIALNASIANSYNTIFSKGIPPIFVAPFDMGGAPTVPVVTPAPAPAPAPAPGGAPVTTPVQTPGMAGPSPAAPPPSAPQFMTPPAQAVPPQPQTPVDPQAVPPQPDDRSPIVDMFTP